MKTDSFNISLNFNQILELVKQLPPKQKLKLSKELEKETIDSKLTEILEAFKTNELTQADIDREVEIVRTARYAKKKKA
ncbi:MAG: type II toxin-antitoxin system VapB15 family antitoxin [Candidatus Cyclobacteriaceae bacterium M2_1C_046]